MPQVQTRDILTYYETQGEKSNPPLILIGGLTRDHTVWAELIPHLLKDFYLITYDNRGAGQTDKPIDPYSANMLADDLAALMDQLEIPAAYIAGHSMGGICRTIFCRQLPRKSTRINIMQYLHYTT